MDHGRRARGLTAILVLAAIAGVLDGPPEPVEPAELVDHRAWVLAPASEDPFAERRPPGSVRDPQGVRPEFLGPDEVFEVDTGVCNYPTVVQETLADLAPGAARAAHRLARDLGEHRELEARAGRSGEQRCGGDADPLRPLLAVECGWILGFARETESPGRRIHRAIERAA